MRKTTLNLIIGILLGIVIVKVSDLTTDNVTNNNSSEQSFATTSPLKLSKPIKDESEQFLNTTMAPGLQIVKVPPPLDLNGRHPYQCYINGKSVSIPVELVEEIICEHGDPSESDPSFNVHNFTGNLKYVTTPIQ
tara:strand:+ start:180 stop:584 length:405 start_codon:yes stop_codon:yes gene_type:complete